MTKLSDDYEDCTMVCPNGGLTCGPTVGCVFGADDAADVAAMAAVPPAKFVSNGGDSDYYKLPPGAVEIQDLVEHRNMNFAVGNIFKAAYRLGMKAGNTDLYDLRKIKWYAERELERLEKLQQENA